MKKLFYLIFAISFIQCTGLEKQAITTEEVTYKYGKQDMVGYIAKPKNIDKKLPAILVVHEWWGQTEYPRKRAEMLAEQGYIAMAVDMYGKRRIAEHPKKAKAFSSAVFKDSKGIGNRFQAAMDFIKSDEDVNPNKIGAMGYCFGGSVVLEAAKQGKDLKVVSSFHGGLNTPTEVEKGRVKADLLVFNGQEDPLVSEKEIKKFKNEMADAEINYIFINYKDAKHGFTNPSATRRGKEFNLPLAYNRKADFDSWQRSLQYFNNKLK